MNHDLFKKHPMDTKAPPVAHVPMAAHHEQVSAKKKSLLDIFQRTDPMICDILDGRKFAALYTISAGSFQSGHTPRWVSGNASGHLFLLHRKEPPVFQVSILHLDHAAGEKQIEFTDYMSLEWDIDTQEHYVFYRCVNREDMTERIDEPIRGLWFKDDGDRLAFHVVLIKAFEELERIHHNQQMHKHYVSTFRTHDQLTHTTGNISLCHSHSTNRQPKQRVDALDAFRAETKQTDQVRELYDLFGISRNSLEDEVEKHEQRQHTTAATPPCEEHQHAASDRIVLRKRQLPRLLGIAVQHLLNAGEQDRIMDAIWNEASSEFCT